MPKNAKALFYMVICVVAAFCVAAARPDLAVTKPSSQTASHKLHTPEKKAHESRGAIRFWQDRERGRWMLHLRHHKCSDIHGKQRRKVCKNARHALRFHEQRLARLEFKLEKVAVPRDTGYLPPEQARELGRRMAAEYGWTGAEWECLDTLWGRSKHGTLEGSWYVYADNPNSEAYGITQANPGSKMGPGWQSSAYVQIKWGLRYIRTNGNFSTPCTALAFRLANGWY